MAKTALIIGATGLVGSECLAELIRTPEYSSIIVLTRKKPTIESKKINVIITDFNNLETLSAQLKADDIFCAMGTTIAKAGTQEKFKIADYHIPLQVAVIAKAQGAKNFILVSSLGATASSPVFYSRTKGELENELKKLNFNSLIIFRPSILLGNRKEKRRGEEIGKAVIETFSFLFAGPLKKYKGTPANLLGKLMVKSAQKNNAGIRIIENDGIVKEDS